MKDESALGSVLASLHLAFDTTFLGLLASVLIMLQLYLIEAVWTANDEFVRDLEAGASCSHSSAVGPAVPAPAREDGGAPRSAAESDRGGARTDTPSTGP